MFSSCALPELGRASATNVNKLTDFQYASLFSGRNAGPSIYPYTQYKLYGTCYMGHILGLVEMLDKIGDKTSLCRGKYGTVRDGEDIFE